MDETIDTYTVERGWTVLTTDGYRVGDVTEVHPTYLLVSRGLFFVNDTYVPLHAVDKVEDGKVRLAIARPALRRMDWKKPPRTPLELVRSDEQAPEEEDDGLSVWDSLLGTTNAEAPTATTWDVSAEPESTASDDTYSADYWQSSTEAVGSEVESYDTLGITTGQRLEVEGGIGLAFQDVGHGEPIVLLHDWMLSQTYWDGLVPRLVDQGRRVITLDWRGHGASDRPWDQYWPSLLVHDLRTLIRTLDLETVTIVGHGLGAAIALQYVDVYPKARTRRLILLNPAAPRFVAAEDFAHGQQESTIEAWTHRLRVDRPALVQHLIGTLLPAAPLDQATERWLWEMAMRPPAYALLQTLFALSMLDLRDELTRVVVPTTVMQGTADRLTPPSLGEAVAASIAGAEYLPFEGAGHLLGLEARDIFEQTLLDLLERDAEVDRESAMAAIAVEGAAEDEVASPDDAAPDDAAAVALPEAPSEHNTEL